MARKKTSQAINVQISPPSTENEQEPADLSPEAQELEDAIDALPEGSVAKLYRIEPNGERAYIDQATPSAMDEARIASHGAGTYVVMFRGPLNDGTNRIGYKKSRRVFIGESAARAAAAAVPVTPAATPNAGGSLLDQVAGGMLVSMMQQMQNMNALQMQQSREHSTAMMTMLAKIAERPATDPLLASLLPALLEKKADPIDQATRIAELSNKGTKSTSELLATLELVEKMREMAGSGGGGGQEKGWMGMVRELAPLVLRQNQQEIATVPALPPGPTPNDQPSTDPGTVPPNVATDLQYLDPVAPYFSHIEVSARNGTDPEIAADFFLSFISGGLYPVIDSILARPSVVPDIVKRAPSLSPYQAWLVNLVGAMRNVIAESTADGDGGTGTG